MVAKTQRPIPMSSVYLYVKVIYETYVAKMIVSPPFEKDKCMCIYIDMYIYIYMYILHIYIYITYTTRTNKEKQSKCCKRRMEYVIRRWVLSD